VNIIENLHENTECAVVIDGHITNWFKVILAKGASKMSAIAYPFQYFLGI